MGDANLDRLREAAREATGSAGPLVSRVAEVLEQEERSVSETRERIGRLYEEARASGIDTAAVDRAVLGRLVLRTIEEDRFARQLVGVRELWIARLLPCFLDQASPLDREDGVANAFVAQLRYFPVGRLYHGASTRVPKSWVLRVGMRDRFRLLAYVLFRMRGWGPTIEVHLPKQAGFRLTPERWIECQQAMADLVARNPELRGVSQANWYQDPCMSEVSPHLAHVGEFTPASGGILVDLGTDPGTVADATWKSRTRRRLYEEGRYTPKRWARLWSRRDILAWAATREASR